MGIFKKICQAFNEFMAVPTARTPAKPGKQTNQAKQTTDLRGKKRNKKNKGQAVPPKQAANQKFYYTGDDDGYGSITPVAGAFATGAAFGMLHDASLTWDSDSDSNISSGSSQDLFQDDGLMSGSMEDMWGSSDPFSHQETLRVGGFDGVIGPDSADLSEQAKWGSPMDDTFSSMDDSFSSSIDDSFSSSFDSNSFGGNSWDD